jgi:hypothetical protein
MKKAIVIVPTSWEQGTKFVGTSQHAINHIIEKLREEGYDVMPPMFNYLFEKSKLGNDNLNVLQDIDTIAYVNFCYDHKTIHYGAREEMQNKYQSVLSHLELYADKGQSYIYDLSENILFKGNLHKEILNNLVDTNKSNNQIVTTTEVLKEIISSEMDRCINVLLENLEKDWSEPKEEPKVIEEKIWVNAEQVAKSIGISTGSVYAHARFKGLPHIKKGEAHRAYRFCMSEVYPFYANIYPRKKFPKS